MELNRRNIITILLVIILSVIFIVVGYKTTKSKALEEDEQEFYKAKIISISDINTEEIDIGEITGVHQIKTIYFKAEIKNGKDKGKIVEATQDLNSMYASNTKEVEKGDKIILYVTPEIESSYIFMEYNRSDILVFGIILFLVLVVVLGKIKGVLTIISLIVTILSIFLVYIPSIMIGKNIYCSTIIVSVFIILTNLLLINGANKKTFCAVLGNIGGLLVSGIIAVIMSKLLNITGIIDEEYIYIMTAALEKPLDLVAIVWGGIVIGSLGAVMDVAMSIASAMNELAENMEKKSFGKMLRSGMNIGNDSIGTMTNTLILAYIGSSLATVLLLMIYNKNILYLFNLEMIVVEIMQAIIGSMGILFAIPATAIIASYVYTKN